MPRALRKCCFQANGGTAERRRCTESGFLVMLRRNSGDWDYSRARRPCHSVRCLCWKEGAMADTTSGHSHFAVEAHGASDVGRVREVNEDAFLVLDDRGLFIVADGVGGAAAGEVASEIAVSLVHVKLERRLRKLAENASQPVVQAVVADVLQEVNDVMIEQARKRPELEGMGTTLVLALLWQDHALIAHLGDSPAYLWRNGQLEKLTEDHSLAAELVRWGEITPSQAEDNPGRSTLLRYLGVQEKLDPDFIWLEPRAGDRLLLCTDGLTGMVGDEVIARILGACDTLAACCQTLIDHANEAGGKDNITVANVRFLEAEGCPADGGEPREELA